MTDLPPSTEHFTLRELCRSRKAIQLGISNDPPKELYAPLGRTMAGCERIRRALGHPMRITSGYRCPQLNDFIGGADDSQHVKGEAVDFVCPAFGSPLDVFTELAPRMKELGIDQIILEPGWIHVSFVEEPRLEALVLRSGRYFPYLIG